MYKVTHTFTCKICNKEYSLSFESETIVNPVGTLPVGWYQFPDGYVCDEHNINITIENNNESEGN